MDWTHIIVHHSATKDGRTHDWEAIRRYHTSHRIDGHTVTPEEFERRLIAREGKRFERPWSDIGYHYGIERVGDSFSALRGRPLEKTGAHCLGMNHTALGVCCVGNYDNEDPPEEMIDLLVGLLRALCTWYEIPVENIKRHSDYASKTCPGTRFDLEAVKERVRRTMA